VIDQQQQQQQQHTADLLLYSERCFASTYL